MSTAKNCREVLKKLCRNNGWSYGVFWCFNQQNSLLLTLQDAYHEDQMGILIDDMLLQVQMLGEGVIGRAAFTKKHEYMFSDIHHKKQSLEGSAQDYCKDNSEFYGQFCFGIKTIAVIPVEPLGVVQFGSFQKLPERMEFVNQAKDLFRWAENREGLLLMENIISSSNSEIFCPSLLFASLISNENSHVANSRYSFSAGEEDLVETSCLTNLIQPFSSNLNHEMINPIEAQVDFDGYTSNIQRRESFPESGSYLDYTSPGTHCSSTWSGTDSSLTSCMHNLQSPMRDHGSQNLLSTESNRSTSCSDTTKTAQERSDSLFFSGNLFRHWDSSLLQYSGESGDQLPTSLCTFEEFLQENDIATTLSKSCPVNNFSHLLSPLPDQSKDLMATTINHNLLRERDPTSTSSYFNGHNQPCDSVQSAVTNVFSHVQKEKYMNVSSIEKLLDCFDADPSCKKSGNWDNYGMRSVSGGHSDFSTNRSKYVTGTSNKLFSSFGINQLMDDITRSSCSVARSSLEDQLPSANKRRKIETSLQSSDRVKLTGLSNMISVHSLYNLDRSNTPGPKSDANQKLESGSLIGDSCRINASNSDSRHEQPTKTPKKKAKPGTRPRPKDRQQIHDRLLELRELIPDGEKMSIDCLLHRTIKHLCFLQSVAEHAEQIIQIGEPKKDMKVSKDAPSIGDCGVTWACEVGDESMICPLIVEDLGTPGQMFIEIRCDKQGSFLEIVDIIKDFGLTILKGVMEACEAKIYARFIVAAEGNRLVTRHEIFSSLIQLLQFTSSNGVKSDQLSRTVSLQPTLANTCQKSVVPLPVSLAETLWCANL